jgi:hypothetical protein
MRWRSGLLTASSALLLAGCGGQRAAPPPPLPKIPAGVAARLATEADHVAALAPGTCAARDAAVRFRADVIASIGRIPARYRETLTSAANGLAERLAACTQPEPPPRKPGKHDQKHKKHGHDKADG